MSGSDKPWIATVGGIEVARAFELSVAQAQCVLLTPHGMEQSLHVVTHARSGEKWIGRRRDDKSWHWTKASAPDPAAWPMLRPRADIDG